MDRYNKHYVCYGANKNKKPEWENRVNGMDRRGDCHVLLWSHLARDCAVTVYIPVSFIPVITMTMTGFHRVTSN